MKKQKRSVMVICAHNDDQIIGVGGTLAKYAQEGIDTTTVIFSYGEKSVPWQKSNITATVRKKESELADKIIGGKHLIYLGLNEGKFSEELIPRKLTALIKKYNPEKLFTHSADDPHPDHKAVHKAVMNIVDKLGKKMDVYSFDVWNPINVRERMQPRLVIDITHTFKKKIEAFKCHKSQKLAMVSLMWNVYAKAIYNGLANDCTYAEIFYKLR